MKTLVILILLIFVPLVLDAQSSDIKTLMREYYELDYKIRQWDRIRQQSGKVVIPENFEQDLARWNQLSAQLALANAKKAADISAEENTKNAIVELIKHEKTAEYALSAIDGMLQTLKAEEEFYKNWEREASLDTGIAITLYGKDRERFQRLKDEAVRRQRELRQQIASLEQKQNYLNNFKSSVKSILSAKEIHSAVEEGDFFSAAEKAIDMGSDIAERVYDKKTFEEVSGRLEVAKGFLDVGNKIYQGNYLDASISAGNTVDKLLADYQKEYDKENKTLKLFMESDFVDKSLKEKALKVIDIANERKSKIEHFVNFKNKVKYVNERLGKFKKYYGYYKKLTIEIEEYERIASMPGRSETIAKLIYGMSKLGDAFNMIADAMPPMLKETIGQFLNFYADALKLGETIDGIVREWFEKREACLNIYGQNIHNSYALKVIEEKWGRDDLCIRPAVEFKQSGLAMYFDDNIGKIHHPIKYFFIPNLSQDPIGLTQEQYSKVVKIASDYSAYASFVESSYRLTNEDLGNIIGAILSGMDTFTINDGYFRNTSFKISELSRDVDALFHIKASIGDELTIKNHREMIKQWNSFSHSIEFYERLCNFKLFENQKVMHNVFVNYLKNHETFDEFIIRQRLTNKSSSCRIDVTIIGDKEIVVNEEVNLKAIVKNARDPLIYEWTDETTKSIISNSDSVKFIPTKSGNYNLRLDLYVKSGDDKKVKFFTQQYPLLIKSDVKKFCSYQYSDWSPCDSKTKKQTRRVISKSPERCVEREKPLVERDCEPDIVDKNKQIADDLWKECIELAREKQYERALHKCEESLTYWYDEKRRNAVIQLREQVRKEQLAQLEKEREERERIERERREREKAERERIERERFEKEKREREEQERIEQEKRERERRESEKKEEDKKKVEEAPTCSYEYSDWRECSRVTKKQTRFVISKQPAGCIERQKPVLEKDCTPPPTEEEKRASFLNCLCRYCGGTMGGHYTPEPNRDCTGRCTCWGVLSGWCTDIPSGNDQIKECYSSVYGIKNPGEKELKEGFKIVLEEKRKHMKPLKVRLKPESVPIRLQFGEIVTLKAEVEGGIPGYKFSWSGNGMGKDSEFIFAKGRSPGSYPISVTVTDSDGNTATASTSIVIEAITVKLEKLSPAGNTVTVGGKRSFKATVMAGKDLAKGDFVIRWEPYKYKVAEFKERETKGAVGQNEVKFMIPGSHLVYVDVLQNIEGRLQTVGESEQITIEVKNPQWQMTFEPERPLVGKIVKATVKAEGISAEEMKGMNFQWIFPDNAKQTGPEQRDGVASFYLKDTKPAKIQCVVRLDGENLGGVGRTITAQGYQVSISQPHYLGPKPRIWKCDTQLGGACPGLVEVADTQFAVFRDIFMKATVTPTPESPRYRWSIDPPGSCGLPGAGDEIKINCSQTGTYTVKVEVTNPEGVKLGEATQYVSITVSQEQLQGAEKSKQAYDKVQQAKQLITQGKLDEAISLVREAITLDPNNQEAKSLSDKWTRKRDGINKNIDNINKFITEKKFKEAEKELNQAKALHPKYAKVVEAEKRLKEEKDKYQREVTNKINQAKRILSEKKIDEAVSLIKEVAKVDKNSAQPVMNQISQEAKKIGWDALHHGDYKQAIKRLEQALELNPNDTDAQKKLKEAKDYQAKMPQIEAKMKEFDQLIAEKKIVSSYQKLLEIHDVLRTMAAGQSSTNPVIIKLNEEYNKLNKWYNEFTKKTNEEWTKYFKEQDWEPAEKLFIEVLKYEHTEPNKRQYESSLQMVRMHLNEKKEAVQYYEQAKANNERGRPSDSKGIDEVIRELNNRVNKFKQTEPMYQNIKSLIGELEKRKRAINAIAYAINFFNSGDMYYRAYQFSNAAKQYKEGLRAIRDNADIRHPLYDKYYKLWEDSVAKDKRFQEIYQYVSAIANTDKVLSEEELNKAIELGEEGLKIVPNSDTLGPALYKVKWKLGELKRQRELQAQCESKWSEGMVLYNAQRYSEALVKFKENLNCAPNNQERRNYVAQLEQEVARKQKADELWNQCIALAKQNRIKDAVSLCEQSLTYHQREDRQRALTELRAAAKKAEEEAKNKEIADRLWNECINLAKANKLNEAVAKCEESLRYHSREDRLRALSELRAQATKAQQEAQNKQTADKLWNECISLAKANRLNEAISKCEQSLSYWSSEDRQRAYNQLKSTLQKTNEENKNKQIADRLWNECIELARQKNYEQAWKKCDESLKYWRNDQRIEATAKLKEEANKTKTSSTGSQTVISSVNLSGTWIALCRWEGDSRTNEYEIKISQTESNFTAKSDYEDYRGVIRGNKIEGKSSTGDKVAGTVIDQNFIKVTIHYIGTGSGYGQESRQNCELRRKIRQQSGNTVQQGRTINAELTNNSRDNVHIFVEGQDTFGSHNRVTPGERKTVSIKAPVQGGFINFVAGRNGQVLAKCRWEYVPDYQNRVPVVRFSDPNILSCSTGLR